MKRPCTCCGTDESEASSGLKRCSGCQVAMYCCRECQNKDWKQHKRYCKHMAPAKSRDLPLLQAASLAADPHASEVYGRALAAAQAKSEEAMVLVTPIAAQRFMQVLLADMLPSGEVEDKMWGLWGEPSSQGYQLLLTAYQKAAKMGNLTATVLMEALCARPAASQALTQALTNAKYLVTEDDSLPTIYYGLDMYLALTEGLQVVSEFDKWPIQSGAAAAAGGGGSSAATAAPAAAAAGAGGGGGGGAAAAAAGGGTGSSGSGTEVRVPPAATAPAGGAVAAVTGAMAAAAAVAANAAGGSSSSSTDAGAETQAARCGQLV